jgi:protein KRI1
LNRGWIDTSDLTTSGSTSEKPKKRTVKRENEDIVDHPWGTLDEEDDFDDKAEEFENTYNFRFEEP